MEQLNKIELSIFERLSISYPSIKSHISFLRVKSREKTGVGMYINFYYNNADKLSDLGIAEVHISTNETIEITGLKYGLVYEVAITNGRIHFIELVTYGEEWNGEFSDNFSFRKWES